MSVSVDRSDAGALFVLLGACVTIAGVATALSVAWAVVVGGLLILGFGFLIVRGG